MSLSKMVQGSAALETVYIKQTCEKILDSVRRTDQEHEFDHYRRRVLANAKVVYGANRSFEIVTVGSDRQKSSGVALVEFMPDGRSFVHFYIPDAKGGTKIGSLAQILTMVEENVVPMFGNLAATQGWVGPQAPSPTAGQNGSSGSPVQQS